MIRRIATTRPLHPLAELPRHHVSGPSICRHKRHLPSVTRFIRGSFTRLIHDVILTAGFPSIRTTGQRIVNHTDSAVESLLNVIPHLLVARFTKMALVLGQVLALRPETPVGRQDS